MRPCKAYLESLKNVFATLYLQFLRLTWRPGLSPEVNRMEGKMVDNTNKDHTRSIQYKQGLFEIITEESSELVN